MSKTSWECYLFTIPSPSFSTSLFLSPLVFPPDGGIVRSRSKARHESGFVPQAYGGTKHIVALNPCTGSGGFVSKVEGLEGISGFVARCLAGRLAGCPSGLSHTVLTLS